MEDLGFDDYSTHPSLPTACPVDASTTNESSDLQSEIRLKISAMTHPVNWWSNPIDQRSMIESNYERLATKDQGVSMEHSIQLMTEPLFVITQNDQASLTKHDYLVISPYKNLYNW